MGTDLDPVWTLETDSGYEPLASDVLTLIKYGNKQGEETVIVPAGTVYNLQCVFRVVGTTFPTH